MPTRKQNLETSLDNIASQIADITANPKPTYSVAGRSISWSDHFRSLLDAQEKIRQLIAQEEGPALAKIRGVQRR